MTLYFAYGRDMNYELFAHRLVEREIVLVGAPLAANVARYRLAFNKVDQDAPGVGHPNMVPDAAQTVYGILYDLGEAPIDLLNSFNRGYRQEQVTVLTDGSPVAATGFVAEPDSVDDTLQLSASIRDDMLRARTLLPAEYVSAIENWPVMYGADADEFYQRLSPSSRAALGVADQSRISQGLAEIDLPHLLEGLYSEPAGPTRALLARFADINNEAALLAFIGSTRTPEADMP